MVVVVLLCCWLISWHPSVETSAFGSRQEKEVASGEGGSKECLVTPVTGIV